MMADRTPLSPSPVRELFVMLAVRGAALAIDFYTIVFGARETLRLTTTDGRIAHAEVQLGRATLMLADEQPEWGFHSPHAFGGSGTVIHLHVDDVDAMLARAVAAGAMVLREPVDEGHGERQAKFRDPFGHEWLLGQELESLPGEEIRSRFETESQDSPSDYRPGQERS
jgi:uncharacterized glyoxalase superfamily protein PhnB